MLVAGTRKAAKYEWEVNSLRMRCKYHTYSVSRGISVRCGNGALCGRRESIVTRARSADRICVGNRRWNPRTRWGTLDPAQHPQVSTSKEVRQFAAHIVVGYPGVDIVLGRR